MSLKHFTLAALTALSLGVLASAVNAGDGSIAQQSTPKVPYCPTQQGKCDYKQDGKCDYKQDGKCKNDYSQDYCKQGGKGKYCPPSQQTCQYSKVDPCQYGKGKCDVPDCKGGKCKNGPTPKPVGPSNKNGKSPFKEMDRE
jgi:hypothetical protein